MIQKGTKVVIVDNTGAKIGRCIDVLGGGSVASVGNLIKISVIKADSSKEVKKGEVYTAVVVGTKKEVGRKNGEYIAFSMNCAVIVKEDRTMKGNRILAPVCKELKSAGFKDIISRATETL